MSSLLAVVDTRRLSPLERMSDADPQTSYDGLLESFLGVDLPETSALLTVVAEMSADDLARSASGESCSHGATYFRGGSRE